jgi:hypothetical protein
MSYRLDPHWDDHDMEPDYGDSRWRGHLYKALISVGVLTAFGAAVLYAYSEGAPSGDKAANQNDLPLVKAQATPVKEKPKDPGGEKVPHRDRDIYRKLDIGTSQAKKTGPSAKAERQEARVPPRPQTYEDILAPKDAAKRKAHARKRVEQRPEPRHVAAAPKPRRAEPEAAPDRTARDKAGPKGRVAVVPRLRHRPSARDDEARSKRDRQVAELSPRSGATVVPKARPRARTIDRGTVQTASAIGPYRVQLGAFRTPTKAQYEWRHLTRANKDVLGSLRMVIERVNLGPKGVYYRLQAGPLKTAPAARGLCRTLGKRKVDCILVNG